MSLYLNKIGLIKYNNTTYQKLGELLIYSVRDPQLVSSDPRIDFFNYPWKSDSHWSYNNFGSGWFYNGKDEIAYTVNIPEKEIESFNPIPTNSGFVQSSFLYNVIPVNLFILSSLSGDLISSNIFNDPLPYYYLRKFNSDGTLSDELLKIKYDNDYRAFFYFNKIDEETGEYTEMNVLSSTYEIENDDNTTIPLILDWSPPSPPYTDFDIMHDEIIVSGYWTNGGTICGILYSQPYEHLGSIEDLYSNELKFNVTSPNIKQTTDLDSLCSNITNGLFTSIPGTDYITGICTTKMLFIDALLLSKKQYVYMRGLFKGNIEIQSGILVNEIIPPSTIIKKVKVKQLQGTFKNITNLPEEIKYGLDHYYAWGWLYGIDNISYTNMWYKNEISGTLKSSTGDNYNYTDVLNGRYTGTLSTTIVTNNGFEDVYNIISGSFVKEEGSDKICGFVEGNIEPYGILMKGCLTGRYSLINANLLKPMQLSGSLFNKSMIGDDLRQILDIKYYNTLGRKGLVKPHSLYGLNLNWSTKNYDPYNNPYMLLTWKIIEYKMLNLLRDYANESTNNTIDLNTYIADKDYLSNYYKSKILKTDELLQELVENTTSGYYLYWDTLPETGDFVLRGTENSSILPTNYLAFNSQVDALKYVKNICAQSNLKLKQYTISPISFVIPSATVNGNITSYILESSDLEIR